MMEGIQSVISEIEPLAKGPIHLPAEHATGRVFPAIAVTMALTSILYVVSFPLIADKVLPGDSSSDTKVLMARRKLCYTITNMSTNLCLGFLGIYFEYFLLPKDPSMAEKVQGQEGYYIFSAIQIGYQAWSLIVGTFFVKERVEMMIHHMSVICVGSMSGFLKNGFRYWTPYFFGIFELSSVPLGLMNAFKDNKQWAEQYPAVFGKIRVVFAASFLTIRIFMLISRLVYLRDVFLVPYLMDSEHFFVRFFLFAVWASSTFLFLLQLYWGYLIILGIVKSLQPKKKKDGAVKKKEQ